MEMIRSSEDHGGGPPPSSSSWVPRPRLLSDPKSLSTSLVKKEVIVPNEHDNDTNDEKGSSRQQQGCRASSGPCALSCLVGRAYTIYVIQCRYKEKGPWTVRKRFRELVELNNIIQDAELRAIFPPRSLCAKAGLACALETRESRLAYYLNELSTKIAEEPKMEEILAFFGAIDNTTAAASNEGEKSSPRASLTSTLASSSSSSQAHPHTHTVTLQDHQAYARLLPVLTKGIMVVKHGRRGSPKKRLIFCNEDCSRIYWASDHRSSKRTNNLSSLAVEDITEVREGTAPDPDHPGQVGTAILRRRRASSSLAFAMGAGGGQSQQQKQQQQQQQQQQQAFSLISPARSLDLEALSAGEFKLMLEGLRAKVLIKQEAVAAAAAAAAAAAKESQKKAGSSPRGASVKRAAVVVQQPPAVA